jgi:hypothetical protein
MRSTSSIVDNQSVFVFALCSATTTTTATAELDGPCESPASSAPVRTRSIAVSGGCAGLALDGEDSRTRRCAVRHTCGSAETPWALGRFGGLLLAAPLFVLSQSDTSLVVGDGGVAVDGRDLAARPYIRAAIRHLRRVLDHPEIRCCCNPQHPAGGRDFAGALVSFPLRQGSVLCGAIRRSGRGTTT